LQNKLRLFKLVTLTFLCCFNSGAFVVVENYGNWKTLSIDTKSAYMTGLWDGYLVYTGEDAVKKKFRKICGSGTVIRVSDLLQIIDSLYEQEINRSLSPAYLLKERGLEHLCRN
tara:strand:- start:273 stop:614 length:342 start_codon:yes stop_codon:yes gene_type:complete